MPSRSIVLALAILLILSLRAASARAQQDVDEPPAPPRGSVRVAGAAGVGYDALGTFALGGSLEADLWGRSQPYGLGLRAGGLAAGGSNVGGHGTLYGSVVFARTVTVGQGLFIASMAAGVADTSGRGLPNNSNSIGFLLIARAGYLVPAGPVRVGIGLEAFDVLGLGGSLLAAPMLDVPF